ncbi:unnamed protein product [Danaus chrysippus]|uniref:(African queen) hypothetical protein n=1 Tax=Danaus chrysippus TaxID=151541 RepID=A0A8J2R7I4_9NEOP|nr:unnamed protein product [Danaus chrysippus]
MSTLKAHTYDLPTQDDQAKEVSGHSHRTESLGHTQPRLTPHYLRDQSCLDVFIHHTPHCLPSALSRLLSTASRLLRPLITLVLSDQFVIMIILVL